MAITPKSSAPVAELYAILGLDSTPLSEALQKSEIDLKEFGGIVAQNLAAIKSSFSTSEVAATAFSRALTDIQAQGMKAGEAIEYLALGFQDLARKQQVAAEMEAISANETSRIAQQRLDEVEAEQISRTEYSRLVQQLNREEIESHELLMEEWMRQDEEMTRADVARMAAMEAANRASGGGGGLPFLSGYGGESGGGGGARGSMGFRLGSGGISPNLRMSEGIGQALGPLLDFIFPVALLGLGIDLWGRFHDSIQNAVDAIRGASVDFDGFAESAKKSISVIQSQATEMTATHRLAERLGISESSLRHIEGGVSTQATRLLQSQIGPLASERNQLGQILEGVKSVPPGGRDLFVQMAASGMGMTGGGYMSLDYAQKRYQELEKEIYSLTEQKVRIQREEIQTMEAHHRALRKMHDAVHEMPNVLPWMNYRSSQMFIEAFGGTATRSMVRDTIIPQVIHDLKNNTRNSKVKVTNALRTRDGGHRR